MTGISKRALLKGSVAASCVLLAAPTLAQVATPAAPAVDKIASQGNAGDEGDIVVTARKRSETALDVPVSLVALGKAELARYDTHDVMALASQVPGLIIAQTTGATGGSIALRGVASSAANPSIDQSVSFNIDGIQVGSANIIRLGQIDMQQIEIFKGPQALFFGKNSPGGIISVRTADPGDHFEAMIQGSHEFYANENTAQMVVSGPVTDTFGVRAVVYGGHMEGYRFNDSPTVPGIAYDPGRTRFPQRTEVYSRVTALFKPSSNLTVRAKYNYSYLTGSDPWMTAERIACPYGAPQVSGLTAAAVDDCKANGHFYQGGFNPNLQNPYRSIVPFDGTHSRQQLASIEVNYNLARGIALTSVSGFYKIHEQNYGNSAYSPASMLLSGANLRRRELSEEMRLTTSRPEWPVNFMIGSYFQNSHFSDATPLIYDAYVRGLAPQPGTPLFGSYTYAYQYGTAYSFFGQAIWKIFPKLELAGGARYSVERKHLVVFKNPGFGGGRFVFQPVDGQPVDRERFTNTSPEATLTWRPTRQVSIFGAFREGFTSGGFNTSGTVPLMVADPRYAPETARGFEGGVKFQTHNLRGSLTAFSYLYKNIQVSTYNPTNQQQVVINGATARTKGIEGDIDWHVPMVPGLDLHGAVSYDHARYTRFLVGCYTGETIAMGCNQGLNPLTGHYAQQNFAGRQLPLAPDWTANAGFVLERPVGHDLKATLTGDLNYKSRYYADLENQPFGIQRSSLMVDASLHLADAGDHWELAVLGRNLSNVYRSELTAQVSFTGNSALTGTNTPGGLSDLQGQINRGREVRLQATYKFR